MKEIWQLQNLSETVKGYCGIFGWFPMGRSSTSSNLLQGSSDFNVGKSQKSHGTRSGEYAGCSMGSLPNCLSVDIVSTEMWIGVLSWCKRKPPSCLFSGLVKSAY